MNGALVRSTAPLRISFVGGGTDFPHYYDRHGGAVLSATIDRGAHVTVSPRTDREIRIRSLDLGHLVEYHLDEGPSYDGVMDLPKAAIARMGLNVGLEIDIASDAPPGSGLGGSSAVVTAVVAALAALEERTLTRVEVAHLAYTIEREDLGIAGGWPVQCGAERLDDLRAHLLLCYTGQVRTDLGLIDTQIRLYEEGREETIVGMKHLHEMAYEMRAAIESGSLDDLGGMLREAYENKKRMNPLIAEGTSIEALVEVAQEAGALGGKICGAGGGGYLLLYCRPEAQPNVREALERRGGQFADFAFTATGVEATKGEEIWRPSP
jgi:D-glycero-alpha-D-manno-heptose-7-phosphate kinase